MKFADAIKQLNSMKPFESRVAGCDIERPHVTHVFSAPQVVMLLWALCDEYKEGIDIPLVNELKDSPHACNCDFCDYGDKE